MDSDNDDFGTLHQENMDVQLKTSNDLDLNVEQDNRSQKVAHASCSTHSTFSSKDEVGVDSILQIGTEFDSDEHAYKFYNKYARLVGFSVRKDWVNRSKVHGQVVSRKFTCSKEGYRRKDRRDVNVRKHRKETRTGCLAHMIITRQPDGKYRVTHFEAQHNHDNVSPCNVQTFPLQRELSVDQYTAADLIEDFRPQSKEASVSMSRQFRVRDSLDDFSFNFDNYLRTERTRDMKEGDAARLMHYFQRQHFENPSFLYALQLDIDDKLSNIFWADDNMVSDYDHFGDVVCFDTVCRTKADHFPFVQFIGVNHHKQVVIFAAALLYDDTVESYKWFLRTFLEIMSGKTPKTIHTDQDAAIIEAIQSVLPETNHCVCVWQMYENAVKNLSRAVKDAQSFANDLKSCIYDSKDEEDFVHTWETMLEKYSLQQNEWLKWMFREQEKWAVVYCKNSFFIDTKGSHLGESLFNNLRDYLNSSLDVLQFFKHFERVVDEQRYKETEASDEMDRCMPKLMGNVVILKHASDVYTPRAFEVFQQGYEKCLNVVVNQWSENGPSFEYKTKKFGQSREYNVTFNSEDDTVICNCRKFECVGFLCSHALKVLDHRNIKVVPSTYILKRWTKDARLGSMKECKELPPTHDNPKTIVANRYKDLCHKILTLSARASESEEAYVYAYRHLDEVIEGVEKILRLKPEEAQGVTSSCMGANASENEQSQVFIDGNAIDDKDNNKANHGERAVLDRDQLTILNEKSSATEGISNVEVLPQSTISCISNSLAVYVSPSATTGNHIMQGLYNFEANQVVKSMYEQPNHVIDLQTNSNLYQPPNFYANQQDSPSQSQLLQDPLIHNTYPESVSNTTQLRQEMDLDIQHSHSASFLQFDQRYRAPDTPYLGHSHK
ncbi:protein FAR1-RELATED SEQUENCE 5-like isoform X1 [Cannabis sativa]|uniref:protein FAR1-RELATED SEQUENCE 5-like isoform X1 n=1 Tax=Cannabis sativa TaxID=3483 RepID=UPI0029CA2549|nr:protein FAR1-RELATED SEQUENCE 5-like isoform X1 [Cannabis sativa]